MQQIQNSQNVLPGVVNIHFLKCIGIGIHNLRRLLREIADLCYFLTFSCVLAIGIQALLEHFLGGLTKLVDVVEYFLQTCLLSRVAEVDGFAVLLLLLGEEEASALLEVNLPLAFEANLFPEECRFVNSNEVREAYLASGLIVVLAAVLQVQVVIAVLFEDLLQVAVLLQFLLVGNQAAALVHANLGKEIQAAWKVNVLLNLFDDLVLGFSQGSLFTPARAQNELSHLLS